MGAGKIDKDLVYKVIYGNLENNSHIRTGQYLFLYSYCSALWRNNRTISLWKRHSKNARFDNRCHEKSDFHMKVAELVAAADSWYFFFLRTSRFLIFFSCETYLRRDFFFFFSVMSSPLWIHDYFEGTFYVFLYFHEIFVFSSKYEKLSKTFRAILWNATSNFEMWLQKFFETIVEPAQ